MGIGPRGWRVLRECSRAGRAGARLSEGTLHSSAFQQGLWQ